MKTFKFLIAIALLFLNCNNIYSQMSYGGLPISYSETRSLSQNIDNVVLTSPNMREIQKEDIRDSINGGMYKIGRTIATNLSLNNSGTWEYLEDGTSVWRLKISSEGAKSLLILYDDFYLSKGSKLFLYNESRTHTIGSFDHRTRPVEGGKFSTQMIEGETTYLELIVDSKIKETPRISIEGVIYIYRGVDNLINTYNKNRDESGFGSSGACQVNINCPQAENWKKEKAGIARILTVTSDNAGYCSGSLINNTSNNGIPYFLTADHCGGVKGNGHFAQWQFEFNYESSNCNNPTTEPSKNAIIGATRIARPSGIEGSGTDFLLFKLNTTEEDLAAFGAYYNGWDLNVTPSPNGSGIHHPTGDIKKISFYTNPPTIVNSPKHTPLGVWHIMWSEGVTSQGSSGSPLFNSEKRVIGTLIGGSSGCDKAPQEQEDGYGRFDFHWEKDGPSNQAKLKPWLNPDNTDVSSLEGRFAMDPNALVAPVADFEGSPTTITVGQTVSFTDKSTNSPNSWSWSFPGAANTNSSEKNPSITYNTVGTFNVSLTATNTIGSNTSKKDNYIKVLAENSLAAEFSGTPTSVTTGGSVSFTDQSVGNPTSWEWTFEGGTPATSNEQNPTVSYASAGVYSVSLEISDNPGTNSDTKAKTNYIKVTDGGSIAPGEIKASFVASNYTITAGDCINFNDQSTGNPSSWTWSFSGAATSTSSEKNPTNICYNSPGEYNVTLLATNSISKDTKVCEACIKVNPNPANPIANFEANQTTILVGETVNFKNLSQNGPFKQWVWTFQGGNPAVSYEETPPPIKYLSEGVYTVELRCLKDNNNQDIEVKTNYINVVSKATDAPIANFTANKMVIQPGESINFIDLSTGTPYEWKWEFEGASTSISDIKNPSNIQYNNPGMYKVTLTVSNNLGSNTMTKEKFIVVSVDDPCQEAPTPAFNAAIRLIGQGEQIKFENLSSGLPNKYYWSFPGGTPSSSNEASPNTPITYNKPGIYKVSLNVSNSCGSNTLTKEKYIYVFTSPVDEFCDTLKSIKKTELIGLKPMPNDQWGYIAGHNGDKIRAYANYYNSYSFNEIREIAVPVFKAISGKATSSVRFTIWDDNNGLPGEVLGEKKVLIKDLREGELNMISLKNPVSTTGPFFIGFRIKYEDNNGDNISDDMLALGIASRPITSENSLYMLKSGKWKAANELYQFSGALAIYPYSCIVDIEEVFTDEDIKIFPNPSSGIVQIKINDYEISNSLNIEILDALGRKIYPNINVSDNNISVDLSSYTDGVYIMKFIAKNRIISKKLLLTK